MCIFYNVSTDKSRFKFFVYFIKRIINIHNQQQYLQKKSTRENRKNTIIKKKKTVKTSKDNNI